MLPTPSTSHVSFDSIYEPAEDSFLFLDTLSSELEKNFLQQHFSQSTYTQHGKATTISHVPLILEVGPGSGVIIAFLTAHARTIFGRDVLSLAVDANWGASRATDETVRRAQSDQAARETSNKQSTTFLSSLTADLTSPLLQRSIDVVIFNPPYVPTEDVPTLPTPTKASQKSATSQDRFVESSHLLSLSYAGGVDGMEVTNRLLESLPQVLSDRGIAYILFCRQNKAEDVKTQIRSWPPTPSGDERKWCAETVGKSGKTAGWEKLEIVRIWRA